MLSRVLARMPVPFAQMRPVQLRAFEGGNREGKPFTLEGTSTCGMPKVLGRSARKVLALCTPLVW